MTERTENLDLIETAQDAVEPHELIPGVFLTRGGYQVTDLRDRIEKGKDHPDRKTGTYIITEPAAFAAYLAKHGLPETELWGSRDNGIIRAVVNAHEAAGDADTIGAAGWGDHVAALTLRHSEDWKDWTGAQLEFAEFIEDHLPNFANPTRGGHARAGPDLPSHHQGRLRLLPAGAVR